LGGMVRGVSKPLGGFEDPNVALSAPTGMQPAPTSPKLGVGVSSEVGLPVYGVLTAGFSELDLHRMMTVRDPDEGFV
jgi:hypothetical protein